MATRPDLRKVFKKPGESKEDYAKRVTEGYTPPPPAPGVRVAPRLSADTDYSKPTPTAPPPKPVGDLLGRLRIVGEERFRTAHETG